MTEWIKCSDRLPTEDKDYLGFDGSIHQVSFDSHTDYNPWRDSHGYARDITHWAELPEPPNSTYTEEKGGYIRGMMATPDLMVEPLPAEPDVVAYQVHGDVVLYHDDPSHAGDDPDQYHVAP